ncbi:MAG: ABC transporter permease [Actinomycetota bacterium]|nr:ABC transporter permease [Actinomycetota bacterium]
MATSRSAFLEAWSNRAGFWTQVVTMIVNDVAWVAFWALFFERVGTVRGWDTERVLLLLAILTTAGGIVLGFLANARAIGRMAANGELDAVLALPVHPLTHLLLRRINTTNLGDIAFGVVLFAVTGHPTIERTAIFAVGVIASAALLTGFLVATGSLSFFAGRDDAGELSFHAILMFAAYPVDVFGGAAKLLLSTVLPAAFVATVPARLIDDFDPVLAAALLGMAVLFVAVGSLAFRAGLSRYTSGSVWTSG